jgi:hypothetical protein
VIYLFFLLDLRNLVIYLLFLISDLVSSRKYPSGSEKRKRKKTVSQFHRNTKTSFR